MTVDAGPTSPKKSGPIRLRSQSAGTQPLVTVLCMTFNQKDHLRECLDAILAQDVSFDVEVLIHDDASTDGTAELAREAEQDNPEIVRAILQTENLYSRNLKVRPLILPQARGKYIAYCDGDDVWRDPRKLAKQVEFLESNTDFVICYHGFQLIDENGQDLPTPQRTKKSRDLDSDALARAEADILNGTLMHRNLPIEFPPEFSLAPNGDAFFPVLVAPNGKAKFLDDIVPLGYRQHGTAAWSAQTRSAKLKQSLQSHLQISAYLLRVGNTEAARHVMKKKVVRALKKFDRRDQASQKGEAIRKMLSQLIPGSKR